MLRTVVLFALVAFATATKVSYDDYKVFRIVPSSNEQLSFLNNLSTRGGYSYWKSPSRLFKSVDLMVSPEKINAFESYMKSMAMKYTTFIENVQKLIDEENPVKSRNTDGFDFDRYHDLDDINNYLESLAKEHPGKVEVLNAGKTYEGRVIKGVKLTFSANNSGVFVEGGMHAREWISPATVLYLIDQFLNSNDPTVRNLADTKNWYMFPVFNADGYAYTHSTDRFWRKTRSPSHNGCYGADPNRNFDYHWSNSNGASDDPCDETYAGKGPFSEIETKSMSDYVKSIRNKLVGYVSFHSYSQLLMFPYGYSSMHVNNYEQSDDIGKEAAKALSRRYGTKYETGSISETIYVASGNSLDWVKGALDIPVTFVYELRDTGYYGFVLPADQIIPNGQEVLDSLIAMFAEAAKYGYN